jgi:SpoVK/Ycf46/Vps4 family AAA+-type ATPase
LFELEARRRIITSLLGRERHELTEEQVEDVSRLTEGYSGADMDNLCKEASMGSIRSMDFSQIVSVRPNQVRAIMHQKLMAALRQVQTSLVQQDKEWDKQYGPGREVARILATDRRSIYFLALLEIQ